VLARSDAGSTPRRKWVLLVDVESPGYEAIGRALGFDGYEVALATTGNEALALLDGVQRGFEPNLVVLDLRESGAGLQLIRAIRAVGPVVPVLVLTASSDLGHQIAALDLGADDYVVKPFALEEVLARIRALLRRGSLPPGALLRFADLELDPNSHEVRRGGVLVDLTRTEFALLELFMLNPGRILTRSQIYERVWGFDFGYGSHSLDVYVGYLRRKTEAGRRKRLIHTVRGLGYTLRAG
jgi:two-component system, OmpR family, response regulator MprA